MLINWDHNGIGLSCTWKYRIIKRYDRHFFMRIQKLNILCNIVYYIFRRRNFCRNMFPAKLLHKRKGRMSERER